MRNFIKFLQITNIMLSHNEMKKMTFEPLVLVTIPYFSHQNIKGKLKPYFYTEFLLFALDILCKIHS